MQIKNQERTYFKSEKHLQEHLFGLDLNLPGGYDLTLIRKEVLVGNYIPDIIYIRYKNIPSFKHFPSPCSYRHSFILWLLKKNQRMLINEIADNSYETILRIEPIISDLLKSNSISQMNSGHYTLSDEINKIDVEIIAVETKLYRYSEALNQATKYLDFADKAVVAIDPLCLPKREKIYNKFRDLGIGLCQVNNGLIDWIIEPKPSSTKLHPEREYLITSSLSSSNQTLWKFRYSINASCHA